MFSFLMKTVPKWQAIPYIQKCNEVIELNGIAALGRRPIEWRSGGKGSLGNIYFNHKMMKGGGVQVPRLPTSPQYLSLLSLLFIN